MALTDFRPMQERCSNCLGCKFIPFDKVRSVRFGECCPAIGYYKFHTFSARGKFQLAQSLEDGMCDYSDETTLKAVQSCTSCGACDISCKICRYNLEPLDHNIEFKNDAIKNGKMQPKLRALIDARLAKNPARADWAKDIAFDADADTVFFPGCKYSYDPALKAQAVKTAKMLIDAGVKLGYLGEDDACCGGKVYQAGAFEDFNAIAGALLGKLRARGVKTIVTPCSDCMHAFKRLYPKLGSDIEVLHVVEYLDRLIKEGAITFTGRVDLTVTYHDPCHLGRLGEPYVAWEGKEKKIRNQIHTWDPPRPRYNGVHGIYDAPRNVIQAIPGVKLVEMERIREYSWCCGAGAFISELDRNVSDYAASDRITEANATGADALVTACPWCEKNFSGAKDENGETIEVLDIVELVSRAL